MLIGLKRSLRWLNTSKVLGYITPMVLKVTSFKLIYAKASEILNTRNTWRIRESLKLDERVLVLFLGCWSFKVFVGFFLP